MLTPEQIDRVVEGREDDPFATLGVHPAAKGFTACVMLPEALSVSAHTLAGKPVCELDRVHPDGLFCGKVSVRKRQPLRYIARYPDGSDYALVRHSLPPQRGAAAADAGSADAPGAGGGSGSARRGLCLPRCARDAGTLCSSASSLQPQDLAA